MARFTLAEEELLSLQKKVAGGSTAFPLRRSDLRTALFGGRGAIEDEDVYLRTNESATGTRNSEVWESIRPVTSDRPLTLGKALWHKATGFT
jgi:hypothetical protein